MAKNRAESEMLPPFGEWREPRIEPIFRTACGLDDIALLKVLNRRCGIETAVPKIAGAELERYARDEVLRLQARWAPQPIKSSTILRSSAAQADRDGSGAFAHNPGKGDDRLAVLLEFFSDATLESHTEDLGYRFAEWFEKRADVAAPTTNCTAFRRRRSPHPYLAYLSGCLDFFIRTYKPAVRLQVAKTEQ